MHFFCIPLAKESQYLFAFEWEAPGEKHQQMKKINGLLKNSVVKEEMRGNSNKEETDF